MGRHTLMIGLQCWCILIAWPALGLPQECPLTLENFSAVWTGGDEIEFTVTITNGDSIGVVRLDGVPRVSNGRGSVAGHLELYLSRDLELNAGDLPLELFTVDVPVAEISAGASNQIRWRARIPRHISTLNTKLVLAVHSGGLIRDGIVRASDNPFVQTAIPFPQEPASAQPSTPEDSRTRQRTSRPTRTPANRSQTKQPTPSADAAPKTELPVLAREEADYAVIPIYNSAAGYILDEKLGRWHPFGGGYIIRNIGGVPMRIGKGESSELVTQAYCARRKTAGSDELVLRPAGGGILSFPEGTTLAPGDSIHLVSSEEVILNLRNRARQEPLGQQSAKLLGIGDPVPLADDMILIYELKSRLTTDGKPLFSRRAYIQLPPKLWVMLAE